MVLGGHPSPAGQLVRRREPADVADLGDQDRTQDRPDPGDRLDRREPRSAASRPRASPVNRSISKSSESMIRRSDAIRAAYGLGRSSPLSRPVPATPNRSLIRTWTP